MLPSSPIRMWRTPSICPRWRAFYDYRVPIDLDHVLVDADAFTPARPLTDLSVLGRLSPASVATLLATLPKELRSAVDVYRARPPGLHVTLAELYCARNTDGQLAAADWLDRHGRTLIDSIDVSQPITLEVTDCRPTDYGIRLITTMDADRKLMKTLQYALAEARPELLLALPLPDSHPEISTKFHVSIAARHPKHESPIIVIPDDGLDRLIGLRLEVDALQLALACVEPYAVEPTARLSSGRYVDTALTAPVTMTKDATVDRSGMDR